MKLALVTGGHRRLGGEIAAALAADGWTLALHGQSDATPEASLLPRLGSWHGFPADLSRPEAVAALLPAVARHFGRPPDLLVNNASVFEWDTAVTATPATLARHHQVNAAAPIALALQLAETGSGGAIVNIVDQRVRNPVPDQFSYTLSKTSLAAATRPLAVALAPAWRVNAVAPGLTLPTASYDRSQLERVRLAMPLERLPAPADIAAAVLFLAAAPAITGQTLFVDGGASMKSFDRDFAFL